MHPSSSKLSSSGCGTFRQDSGLKSSHVRSGSRRTSRRKHEGSLLLVVTGFVVFSATAIFGQERELTLQSWATAVTLQADGKIIVTGQAGKDFALVRYRSDGGLDTSFGKDGKVTTSIVDTNVQIEDVAHDVAVQADGKIAVVGRSWTGLSNDFAIVRYNFDGSLDKRFDATGIVTTDFTSPEKSYRSGSGDALSSMSGYNVLPPGKTAPLLPLPGSSAFGPSYDEAFALAIQADGKLLVGGTSLARYNLDGSLDTSFGSGGWIRAGVRALALQKDGKIVVVGTEKTFAVTRYRPDGSLDMSFGVGGKVTTRIGTIDTADGVAVQVGGKFVVAGSSYDGQSIGFAMCRYYPDGHVDVGFGEGGKVVTHFCGHKTKFCTAACFHTSTWRVSVQKDGKILVAGSPSDSSCQGFIVTRYTADGSLDSTFGKEGRVTTMIGNGRGAAHALAIQPDGKIVVAGNSDGGFALARYRSNGSLDPTFGKNGMVTTYFRKAL